MKQLKILKQALKIAALLSLGNLAQARAENSIAITPFNLNHTQIHANHALGNVSAAFHFNDFSPLPYFLKKEGRQKLELALSYKDLAAKLEKRASSLTTSVEGKRNTKLGPAFLEFKPSLQYSEFQERERISLGIESRIHLYFPGLFLKSYLKEETATKNHWYEYKVGTTTKRRTFLLGYRDHQTDSIARLKHIFCYGEATFSGLTLSAMVDKTFTNGYFYGEGGVEYISGHHQIKATQIMQKDSSYPLECLSAFAYTYKSFSMGALRNERGKISPFLGVSKSVGRTQLELSYGTKEFTDDKRAKELKLKISSK